ncbi:MAG: TolC family protein, partial [Gemmatimonadota bacterium]
MPTGGPPRRTSLLLLFAALLAPGCSLAPDPGIPAPVSDVPAAYEERDVGGDYDATRWWAAFDDPVLNGLVDEALSDNLDLAEAVARLREVRAQERVAESGLWPSASASGNVSNQSSPLNTGTSGLFRGAPGDTTGTGTGGGSGGAGGGDGEAATPDRFDNTNYTAWLSLAYEVDFWGRVRNDARAASLDRVAAEADVRTARLGVIGQVVQTYFEVVDLRRHIT